ncbi:hypothetical protein RIF29_15143 [Crotalaria pallida]|uniref:Uncharacterized protein n=1 Tax=Crotalaria pallida TaxID=3830 RepID=A0AAN9ICC5_CROPI
MMQQYSNDESKEEEEQEEAHDDDDDDDQEMDFEDEEEQVMAHEPEEILEGSIMVSRHAGTENGHILTMSISECHYGQHCTLIAFHVRSSSVQAKHTEFY